jgi:hypothetical protein
MGGNYLISRAAGANFRKSAAGTAPPSQAHTPQAPGE